MPEMFSVPLVMKDVFLIHAAKLLKIPLKGKRMSHQDVAGVERGKSQDETCAEVECGDGESGRTGAAEEQRVFVDERGESGEAAAETCDQKQIFFWSHYVVFLDNPEKQSYKETA